MPSINHILAASIILGSFAGGYWLADNSWQSKNDRANAENAKRIAQLSEQYREREYELVKNAEALDRKYTESLSDAERRIDRLSSDIAAGPKRVFVRAKCPSPSTENRATSSVGDGAASEITGATRQDYLHLTRAIARQDAQVRYLQDYVRQQCSSPH